MVHSSRRHCRNVQRLPYWIFLAEEAKVTNSKDAEFLRKQFDPEGHKTREEFKKRMASSISPMTHPNTNTELPEDIRVQLDAITALADILPPRPLPGHDYTCVITPKHAEELHVRFHAIRAALAQQNEERPHGVDDGARKECRAAQCRRIRAEMQGVIDELRERVAVMESAQEE